MKLYKYKNYDEYKNIQTKGNKEKINKVWAKEKNIKYLCENVIKEVRFGICHGVRNGKEVEWFKKYLCCEVIGTEISDTASNFNMIQWDFHNEKIEWICKADFIYTNSFDHAFDPPLAIQTWKNQLAKGGKLIIEHTSNHEESTELDPFGAIAEDVIRICLDADLKLLNRISMIDKKASTSYGEFLIFVDKKN